MIHIMLNNAKMKILKNIVFSILNRCYEYAFLSNGEHWHAYIVDIIDTKVLKIKATKDWETINKNVWVINSENKGFDKIHISSIFLCEDAISLLPEPLQIRWKYSCTICEVNKEHWK